MRLVIAALVVLGCGRDASPSESDSLWSLTPAGARGAIVISPRGVAAIEAGYQTVRRTLDEVADFGIARAQLAELMAPVGGPAVTLADFGFSAQHGAALFLMKDGMVAVLPVADRDKFLARVHGTKGDVDRVDNATCKPIKGHYACATSEAALATLGQGDLKKHLAEVHARGEIEIVGAELPFGEEPVVVAAAIQLARGAGTLRATVIHVPGSFADRFTVMQQPAVDTQHAAGFALLDLRPWLPSSQTPLVGDITVGAVLATLDGMLAITAPAGVQQLQFEQPISDPAPLKALLEHCDQLPGGTLTNGACQLAVADWAMSFDAWLDGNRLVLGKKTPEAPKSIPMSPIGSELARGTWSLVFWGRGTMLAGAPMAEPPAALSPENAAVLRAWSLLNELGFATRRRADRLEVVAHVRTLFANPDDVVAKLLAISADDIAARRAGAQAEPIARSSPSAPFAADYQAGHAGLLAPTMLTGAGVTLAIPALMQLRRPAPGNR